MDGTTATSFLGKFTSPWRNLAWSFRKSRDNWKKNFQELKSEHKRLQNQVHDVRKSREEWRSRSEHEQTTSAALRADIARLQTELAAEKATSEKNG